MGEVLSFEVKGGKASFAGQKRTALTRRGCNEPFKDRFWCPKQRWFMMERCPFMNQRECRNFAETCGGRI